MAEIATSAGTFRVEIDGPQDAPVLLMSHSLGCDLTMWDSIMPALTQRLRVVRYDARGHGASVVTEGPVSMARLARDALAVLDAIGVEKAHFVGLSMGGMVGQWLLANAPGRLGRVVLANTAPRMAPEELWNARIRHVAANGMAGLVDGVMERWFTARFRKASPRAVAAVAKVFLATKPAGYASCCAAIRDMDQRWSDRSAKGETLVIIGAQDPATPPAAGELIAAAIPGARAVTLDAAHLSSIERPQEFAAALLDFVFAPARKRPASVSPPRARKPAVVLSSRAAVKGRPSPKPPAAAKEASKAPPPAARAARGAAKAAPGKPSAPKTAPAAGKAQQSRGKAAASPKASAAKPAATKTRPAKAPAARPPRSPSGTKPRKPR